MNAPTDSVYTITLFKQKLLAVTVCYSNKNGLHDSKQSSETVRKSQNEEMSDSKAKSVKRRIIVFEIQILPIYAKL